MHASAQEAMDETLLMLDIYADFCQNFLAMPVVKGVKTAKEKFSGAVNTYTIECMMHDRKALQSGTTHYFGDGFSQAFQITYTGKDNKLHHPHQTSWGLSTRLIGGIIMTHGDNNGLVLPPKIAPLQAMVIPVQQKKEGVLEASNALLATLKDAGLRVKMDDSDKSPGWKAAEYEMKGVPLRVELGPKDLEKQQCCVCRRDTGEKIFLPLEGIVPALESLLEDIQASLFRRAKENLDQHTKVCLTMEDVQALQDEGGGFAKTMWCGDLACEEKMKENLGVSSRCMPMEQEKVSDTCVCCQKPAEHMIYWGNAY